MHIQIRIIIPDEWLPYIRSPKTQSHHQIYNLFSVSAQEIRWVYMLGYKLLSRRYLWLSYYFNIHVWHIHIYHCNIYIQWVDSIIGRFSLCISYTIHLESDFFFVFFDPHTLFNIDFGFVEISDRY